MLIDEAPSGRECMVMSVHTKALLSVCSFISLVDGERVHNVV